MILWMIENLLISALLLSTFVLFFRMEHKHHWNRIYLLSALIISIMLPLIPMATFGTLGLDTTISIMLPAIEIGPDGTLQNWASHAGLTTIVLLLWSIGAATYLFFVLREFFMLTTHQGLSITVNETDVMLTEKYTTPFSFFGKIFLPLHHNYSDEQLEDIILHEKSHGQHKHTVDLIIAHAIGALTWWNPFYYLFYKALRNVHEYQADAQVIKSQDPQAYSRLLWQNATSAVNLNLAHPFFNKPLKNRIIMIKKSLQSKTNDMKYLLIIPISLIIFGLHACKENLEESPKMEVQAQVKSDGSNTSKEVLKVAEQMPRFPGCESEPADDRKICAQRALLNYIFENVKYPETAKKSGLEGTVLSKFVVSSDGQVYDLEIVSDPGQGMGDEVLRVLKQMSAEHTWVPGIQKGKAVNVEFTLPVKFKLS